MFKRVDNHSYENVNSLHHKEFEHHNTSVLEYFRKYSSGKTDMMPTDPRAEVSDQRPESEMIEDDSVINHMSCDDLDALMEFQANQEKFEKALSDIELTKTQRKQFDDAVKVLNDPNSTTDAKREAYTLLEELHDKVTRARKS